MPNLSAFSFKSHILWFWLICLIVGILFAFIIDANWNTVVVRPDGDLVLPASRTIMILYCTFSYLCLGLSYSLIAEHPKRDMYELAVLLFWIQFFLILLWLGIFFGLHLPGLALLDLLGAVLLLIFIFSSFRTLSLAAMLLLLPYGGLVCLLAFMNIYVFLM